MKKLPPLISATRMLCCAEDLGMIPDCVHPVMQELSMLSLEVQRMPKDTYLDFGNPAHYPYLCVCTTGTHDMSTLRGWWEEDRAVSGRFTTISWENQETHRIIANLPFVWKSLKGTCKARLCYVYFPGRIGCRYQENYAGKIHTGNA